MECWISFGSALERTATDMLRQGHHIVAENRASRRLARWFEDQLAQMDGRLTSGELWSESFVSGRVRFEWIESESDDPAPPEVTRLPRAPVGMDVGYPSRIR
ncbi:MAG: hypothetical protein R3A52_27245 [Polyangiales bacterium]